MIPDTRLFTHKAEFDKNLEIGNISVVLLKLHTEKATVLNKYDFEA